MAIRDQQIFRRALSAAAGVTGVLKVKTAAGVAGLTLALAACSSPTTTVEPTPQEKTVAEEPAPVAAPESDPKPRLDVPVAAEPCADDPGFGSKCCTKLRDEGKPLPIGCTPWGPPAPPVYQGEAIA